MDTIPLVTSIAPLSQRDLPGQGDVGELYQGLCIESWKRNGFRVISVNAHDEVAIIRARYPSVEVVERPAIAVGKKNLVPISELIDVLRGTGLPVGGIVNADILFEPCPSLAGSLRSLAIDSLVYCRRQETGSIFGLNGSDYSYGYDAFFFDTKRAARLDLGTLTLGTPWWDYFLPLAFLLDGGRLIKLDKPSVFHLSHPIRWDKEFWRSKYFETRAAFEKKFLRDRILTGHFPDDALSLYIASQSGYFFRYYSQWSSVFSIDQNDALRPLDIDNHITAFAYFVLDFIEKMARSVNLDGEPAAQQGAGPVGMAAAQLGLSAWPDPKSNPGDLPHPGQGELHWALEQLDDRSFELDLAQTELAARSAELALTDARLTAEVDRSAEGVRRAIVAEEALAALRAEETGLRSELAALAAEHKRAQEVAAAEAAALAAEKERVAAEVATELERVNALLRAESGRATQVETQLAELRARETAPPSEAAPPPKSDVPFPEAVLPGIDEFTIAVVDVGAQVLSFMDHVYAPLMRGGRCSIVGFEPLTEEAAKRAELEPNVQMLPDFIGDGKPATFHINAMNATSSLYESNPEMFKYHGLSIVLPTLSTQEVATRRLDDIDVITSCDYLKIDVQGGELKVLRGATKLLKNVSAIHLEVEHAPVYSKQPLFCEVHTFLQKAGFELIDLFEPGYDTFLEAPVGTGRSQLLWNDALYMKVERLSTPAMCLKSAYIAHVNYAKYDLAARRLAIYDKLTGQQLLAAYQAAFGPATSTPSS